MRALKTNFVVPLLRDVLSRTLTNNIHMTTLPWAPNFIATCKMLCEEETRCFPIKVPETSSSVSQHKSLSLTGIDYPESSAVHSHNCIPNWRRRVWLRKLARRFALLTKRGVCECNTCGIMTLRCKSKCSEKNFVALLHSIKIPHKLSWKKNAVSNLWFIGINKESLPLMNG
jgi:hypothetical protein